MDDARMDLGRGLGQHNQVAIPGGEDGRQIGAFVLQARTQVQQIIHAPGE
jgi:hypothetical protein